MFLRRVGNQILMLQSYRDGRGKVRQRRLGDFRDLQEVKDPLWRVHFQIRFPEIQVDWSAFILRAEELLATKPPPRRQSRPRPDWQSRIRQCFRDLNRALLEQPALGAEVRQHVERLQREHLSPPEDGFEFHRGRVQQTRLELPRQRRKFECRQRESLEYLASLESLAEDLRADGRLGESLDACQLRVESQPDPAIVARYGRDLQRMGQWEAAREQYLRLPKQSAIGHFNLASLCLQQGNQEEALVHLLRGLSRDRWVAEALKHLQRGRTGSPGTDYWCNFASLWRAEDRKFLLDVYSQFPVRWKLRLARERGVTPRVLLPRLARQALLAKLNRKSQQQIDLEHREEEFHSGLVAREASL